VPIPDADMGAVQAPLGTVRSDGRCATDADDRIAWLALLRAPWCGLSLRDLHRLAATDGGTQRSTEVRTVPELLGDADRLSTLSADGQKMAKNEAEGARRMASQHRAKINRLTSRCQELEEQLKALTGERDQLAGRVAAAEKSAASQASGRVCCVSSWTTMPPDSRVRPEVIE